MFSASTSFTFATKALFESQIATYHALAGTVVDGVEKAIALNLAATQASVEESIAIAKHLSSVKDPQEFFTLSVAQVKSPVEKMTSYGRHLNDIASGMRDEFTKAAEAQFTDTKDKITALVDDIAKNAPDRTENVAALLKSAIGNASAGYEQLTKATKQAVATVEGHVAKAAEKFSPVVPVTAHSSSSVAKE